MFSVIIPSYNKIDFIEVSIKSVLSQSYKKFELIIVDDGSTDGSQDIILHLKSIHPEIKTIFQKNSGVSTARNNGVIAAKYPYIAFLDADDWWETEFLKEMLLLIENCPDAGLYSSNFFKVKNGIKIESGIVFPDGFVSGYINYFSQYIASFRQLINSSSVVIPIHIFKKVGGFNPCIAIGEDFDLWIRIAVVYKVAYCNLYLSNYNQDSNSNFRATKKLPKPESNYVFYFPELYYHELKLVDLKILLDHIRLGIFKRYRRSNIYILEANTLINHIDISRLSYLNKLILNTPIPISRLLIRVEDLLALISKSLKFLK